MACYTLHLTEANKTITHYKWQLHFW